MAQSDCPQIQTISLHEDVVTSGRVSVDREKGVLRGVKILGLESANGRTYTRAAIREAASKYEGLYVNRDHPARTGGSRSADDRLGWLEGVRVEGDGLYGDLHYLMSHPFAARLVEAAERRPGAFGLSHNAQGRGREKAGKFQVENIVSVKSVDLVADPATTKGLFEEQGMGPEMAMADGGGTPEDKLSAGFEAAIMAVVSDKSMDVAGKVSKIRDLLKMHEKAMGGGSEGSSDGGDSQESPAAEAVEPKAEPTLAQLQEQVAASSRELNLRKLCDAAQLIPNPLQLKALVALTEEADQKALVQQFKSQAGKVKSTTARDLTESKPAMPADARAFAKAITVR